MGKIITNIAIALGLLTVVFGGYYLYLQREAVPLDVVNSFDITEVLDRTNVFMEYRSKLEKTKFNLALFEDKRFTTLHSYRTEIKEQTVGKVNPFYKDKEDISGGSQD